MTGAGMNEERGKRLEGLKAVASYLGVDRVTVWRWVTSERNGCPVQRLGGRYFAWAADLDAWQAAGCNVLQPSATLCNI